MDARSLFLEIEWIRRVPFEASGFANGPPEDRIPVSVLVSSTLDQLFSASLTVKQRSNNMN